MRNTFEVYNFMKKEIKANLVVPRLLYSIIKAMEKVVETKIPMLIHGEQGTGKTFGVQYFAYQNGYEITILNASDELRKKEAEILVRAELLKPSKNLKFLVLDEVERGSNLGFLAKMVDLNRKMSHKTNVVMICITNHYWQLGTLKTAFKSFHEEIKPPYVKTLGAALREMGVEYQGPIIRDLRFFRSVLQDPKSTKFGGISDNTFQAMEKFLSADYKDRDASQTKKNLNAPFWKWFLSNFAHGTFMHVVKTAKGSYRTTHVKHNTGAFYRAINILSLADKYGSDDLLDFVVPQLNKPYLMHPSSLAKRNRK